MGVENAGCFVGIPARVLLPDAARKRGNNEVMRRDISGGNMTWNYRIFRHRQPYKTKDGKRHTHTTYALHEAHYDKNGKMDGWTADSVSSHGDSPKELIEILEMMLNDAKKSQKDIVDYK